MLTIVAFALDRFIYLYYLYIQQMLCFSVTECFELFLLLTVMFVLP